MGKVSKVVVCGLKGIGKTSLLEQLIYGNFEKQDIHPTIEDIYVATIETERGTKEVLRFYDIQGLSPYESAEASQIKQYYSTADAFVLIYRVDSRLSFDTIDALKKEIDRNRDKREITIIAIGISSKNCEKREVDPSFAIGWATREKFRHFEVILADRKTLVLPFAYLASKLNPPPAKTSFAPLGLGTRKGKE